MMNQLFGGILDAHGGIDRWRNYQRVGYAQNIVDRLSELRAAISRLNDELIRY